MTSLAHSVESLMRRRAEVDAKLDRVRGLTDARGLALQPPGILDL
jgi:hypothetical protein